jgi:hypothetical protein
MFRYILMWIPMVFIAIANGAARDLGYGKHTGERLAHQISTLIAVLLFTAYIWTVLRNAPPRSGAHAAAIGILWLGLTVAFEFLFGHYGAGLPWSRLWSDYDVLAGRLWVLIPLWLGAAPFVFYRVRAGRRA